MEIKRTKKEMADFLPELVIKHNNKITRIDARDRERVKYECDKPRNKQTKYFLS
jgi:hypothetical protein